MAGFERKAVIGQLPNAGTSEGAATRALADTLQGFGQWGLKKHGEMRIGQAQTEAQALTPTTQAPELKTQATQHGQAYNKIVMAGHAAAIKNDYTANFQKLHMETTDPEEFYAKAKAYKIKTLADAAPKMRNVFELDMDNSINHYGNDLASKAMESATKESFDSLKLTAKNITEDAGRYVYDGDLIKGNESRQLFYAGVIEPLIEMGRGSEANILADEFEDEMDNQLVLGQAYNAIKSGNGDAFIRNFMDNPPKDLSRKQVDYLQKSMAATLKRRETTLAIDKSAMSIEQAREISNLKINASLGFGEPQDTLKRTEELFNTGLISPSERTSIFKDVLNADKKNQEKQQKIQDISDAISSDNPVDVLPKDQDEYYESIIIPAQTGQPPEVIEKMNIAFVNRVKRVPTRMRQSLNAMALSDDPNNIIAAAKFADAIDQTPGLVESAFDERTEAFVSNVAELMTSMSGAEAVIKAKELTDPRNKAMIEQREIDLKKSKTGFLKKNYADKVESHFNEMFDTKIDELNKDQIAREYKTYYETYYKSGMSETAAEKASFKKLDRNWSEFNGRMMQYSPENYYSVGGETGYILDQLVKDVKKENIFGYPVKKKDIFLFSDEKTARTASEGKPQYRYAIMIDGSLTTMPGYWVPNIDKEIKRVQAINLQILKDTEKYSGTFEPFPTKGLR